MVLQRKLYRLVFQYSDNYNLHIWVGRKLNPREVIHHKRWVPSAQGVVEWRQVHVGRLGPQAQTQEVGSPHLEWVPFPLWYVGWISI